MKIEVKREKNLLTQRLVQHAITAAIRLLVKKR